MALAIGSPEVRVALLIGGLFAVVSFVLAFVGHHKTLGGQLWGVIGLTVPCVPILLAGGVSVSSTAEIWGAWLIGFTATTMAVRGVIAAQKRDSRTIHWAGIIALSLLALALNHAGFPLLVVSVPMLVMSWYLMIDPPHASQLKRVGWALVAGSVTSAVWMIVAV